MHIDQVRQYAFSLPDVTEEPHHHFSSFCVRGKIFGAMPPDWLFIHVFVKEQQCETALALHPAFAFPEL